MTAMEAAIHLLLLVASTAPPTPPPARVSAQQLAPTVPASIRAGGASLHAPSALPWDDVFRVRSFDPALGTLVPSGSRWMPMRSDVRVENQDDVPCSVLAQSLALVTLGTASVTTFAHLPFESEVVWVPSSFDGTVDFEGASGRRRLATARRHAEVVLDDPARLVEFLDPDGVVDLPVSAVGTSVFVGGGSLAEQVGMDAGLRVEVEYLVASPVGGSTRKVTPSAGDPPWVVSDRSAPHTPWWPASGSTADGVSFLNARTASAGAVFPQRFGSAGGMGSTSAGSIVARSRPTAFATPSLGPNSARTSPAKI
jgi:hypothetical protein